jgi:DNA-binding MarR family transcriptional regulator
MTPIRKPPHFDSLEQEAFLNLWRTYDRLRNEEDTLFSTYDLTAQQYNALRLLRAVHPGSLPTLSLAAKLISRAPDITRLLDKLVQRGLVVRCRPPQNRRVVEVGITPEGLDLVRELDEPVRQCHVRQLGHLSPIQLRSLIELLRMARHPHESADGPWTVKLESLAKSENDTPPGK